MNQLLIKKGKKSLKRKKNGFTLIELIIVIAVIGILAGIAIPKFGQVKENSNKTSDIANAKNISMAASKAIADGNILYTTAIDASPLNAVGGYDLTKELDGINEKTTLKTTAHKNETFKVAVDTKGNVTVTASGGVQIYPTADSTFNN